MKKKLVCISLLLGVALSAYAQKNVFISPLGDDRNEGSKAAPLHSLGKALELAETTSETQVNIYFRGGTYYVETPERITPDKMGTKQLRMAAWEQEPVQLCGTKKLKVQWKKAKKGLWKAAVSSSFDQLWINGKKRVMARYPNMQEEAFWGGTSEEALSAKRIRKWKNPAGGFIHSMHAGMWGSQHYRITGKEKDSLLYEGGYQVTRPSSIHPYLRYVENIKEELDVAGEWFWDKNEEMLYYYPFPGELPGQLDIEVSATPQLLIISGTEEHPMRHVTIEGICFTRTCRTFMEPYETLMRSDWGIYRGGALVFENTEDCKVARCEFKELGGNALFVSRYALNDTVKSNYFHHIGGSAVCLVGDTAAVRSGAYGYSHFVPYADMDLTPGPRNARYPRQCLVEDNLIHHLGTVEKQVAGVEIQIAAMIQVGHNTMYDLPRAGINVGDGAFGGHLIEYNDIFDTVLETSDHGAFNSWGRDRFWHPDYQTMNRLTRTHPELILLDALYTTVIRNNRFRCDHGWDIDLDDGSSNYHIYQNICLRGGIKLREGFYRKVENNILVNSSLHPHLWFSHGGDVIRRNLFMQPYFPIALNGWGEQVDFNFFSSLMALEKVRKEHTDTHSLSGMIRFADAANGDYTLPKGSEAFRVGFENIPMNRFGVYSPSLKKRARQPDFPAIQQVDVSDETKTYSWLGAQIRPVKGLGDRSAFGLPDEKGVIVVEVEKEGLAGKAGLQANDVIRSVGGEPVSLVEEMYALTEQNRWKGRVSVVIFRGQQESVKTLSFK